MKQPFILILTLTFSILQMTAQEQEYITAIAECINIQQTGKRHNSFFFTFKIKKVVDGEIKDSIVWSHELYHDFGGGQILRKLNLNNALKNNSKGVVNEVIIKFAYDKEIDGESRWLFSKETQKRTWCKLKWVAEKDRRKSFENLERFLKSNLKPDNYNQIHNFLAESNGKFWFQNNLGEPRIVVEKPYGSSNWEVENQ